MAGESHQLGTVTFHKDALIAGTFELRSGVFGPTDDVLDLSGRVINDTTTFNSAFLVNVSEHDFDGDGIGDSLDNCSQAANPAQDDTDLDDCGNLCDADYTQTGIVSIGDFGFFINRCIGAIGGIPCVCQHREPICVPGRVVSIGDFGFFSANFGTVPGPSGTTAGTTACP